MAGDLQHHSRSRYRGDGIDRKRRELTMATRPGGPYRTKDPETPTKSQLIPLSTQWKQLFTKAHLIPFVILFLALFLLPNPALWILFFLLAAGAYYLIYRLCGKTKPSWLPLVPAAMTAVLVYWFLGAFNSVFGIFLGGNGMPAQQYWPSLSFSTLFYDIFFFVGLKEELIKAVPVLLIALLAPKIRASFARPLEIHEPLDGILIATGSALGFTMVETMMQYVPNAMTSGGFSAGLNLLFVRVGADPAGHIAYSGYFGYFIGLAMMMPKNRWKTIAIGWLCAGTLHALWDSLTVVSAPLLLGVGIVSYAFLGAAILKARQISPSRGQNFATQLYRGGEAPPPQSFQPAAYAPAVQAPAAPAFQPAAYAPPTTAAPTFTTAPATHALTFFVAGQRLLLTPGRRLTQAEMPGLQASAGDGVVAEVTRHPTDPNLLGLRNLSSASWMASTPAGETREIPSGKTIRLAPGTSVQFASIRGEILQ
jgi:RsiW-degrading membrane proteinase PrsW (M82 family)